jgi:hypothetical protein
MINNKFIENCAKAFNNESFNIPTKFLVSTDNITVTGNLIDTDLTGEVGTRKDLTFSRASNIVTYNCLRSGANVINTSLGDNLKVIALMTSASEVMTAVNVSGLLQTTDYDIDFDWQIRFIRN